MSVADLLSQLEGEGARLWEESGRIRFRAPPGVMTEERRGMLAESRQAVLDHLRRRQAGAAIVARPGGRFEPFDLTEVQTAYLFGRLQAFAYGGVACHGYGELLFPDVSHGQLQDAWRSLIRRHDMLRAVIDAQGTQRVLEEVPDYDVGFVELRGVGKDTAAARIDELRGRMSHRIHPSDRWPLFELCVSMTEEGALVHFSIDFLIADLVSTQVLFDELHELCYHPEEPLPPLDITFRDHVVSQSVVAPDESSERARDYWLRRVDDLPPPPDLPVRMHDPNEAGGFRRWQTILDSDKWMGLRALAGSYGITPSVAILAAYSEVVARWSRHPRFTLNLTLQNRPSTHPQVDRLVGDFTSIALLAVERERGSTLRERALALHERLWLDLDNRAFSGLQVARELSRRRGAGAGLFPIVFTSAIGVSGASGPRTLGNLVYGITQTPQVWIDCQAMESDGALVLNWDVREDVFPSGVIDEMFEAFERLVIAMSEDARIWDQRVVVSLPATQQERRRRVNAGRGPLPTALLHEGILQQADRAPHRPAVIAGGASITYAHLVGRAAAVAETLVAGGVNRQEIVAIVMDKGVEQIAATLGVLLAGCVYLPIDSTQPPARRNAMLTDAQVRCVLTQSWLRTQWPSGSRVIAVDRLTERDLLIDTSRRADPDQLAYVMYTSGSTGTPKGVMISHRSALNTVQDVNRRFGVNQDDRVLGLASIGFDLSVYDLFGPLAVGGALVLPDHHRRSDPSHWVELLSKEHVTIWNSVPAQLQMLRDHVEAAGLEPRSLASLRLALVSGDWIPVRLPDEIGRLAPSLLLVGLGGATEAAIWSIFHVIDRVDLDAPSVPYGKPLTNQTFHVLDAEMLPCPDLVAGELFIGGVGLARGYLADEERTRERFPHHPETGERLYRTGDFGRWLPDGSIEFLGREDRQVKIRGHRIELAEVEAALLDHPAIARAVVLAVGDRPDRRRLAAVVETGKRDEDNRGDLPGRLAKAVEGRCAAWRARVDLDLYELYSRRLDQAALLCMQRALRGLCALDGDGATQEEVLQRVDPSYRRVVRRWIEALLREGLLRASPSPERRLTVRDVVDDDELSATWKDVVDLARGVEDLRLVDYFRTSMMALPELLRAESGPLEILLPEGRVDLADALYRGSLVRAVSASVASAAIREIVDGWPGTRPLRVLEVGGGLAGASEAVLDELAETEIEYLFTDSSPFFLHEARRRLADYPFVGFGALDLERSYRAQGLLPNSFDIVLAVDVLHATRDVEQSLATLAELAAPGGWLIVAEMSRDRYPIMASLELLLPIGDEGGDFDDVRRGRDQNFLSAREWRDAFERVGAPAVLQAPSTDDPVGALGVHVFAAQAKRDRIRVEVDEIRRHLSERLPAAMLPATIQLVDALPVTANGKIDYQTLVGWTGEPEGGGRFAETEAPVTDLELRVASTWTRILELERPAFDSGFLELGGDSLLAARLAGLMREELPEAADVFFDDLLRQVLEGPTVRELAAWIVRDIEQQGYGNGAASPLLSISKGPPPVRVLIHDGSGTLESYGHCLEQLAERGALVGLVADGLEAVAASDPSRLIDDLGDEYAGSMLDEGLVDVDVVGDGPGAVLALETSRRLGEAGATVRSLTIVAGFPPFERTAPGARDLYACIERAVAEYEIAPYAGDVTVVVPSGGTIREEVVKPWNDVCLGDLKVVEATSRRHSRFLSALAGEIGLEEPG